MTQSNKKNGSVIQDGETNQVSKVVIFFDRALVTRSASVAADAGINRFEIATQAVQLDGNSVTAQILGAGQILGVRYRTRPVAEAPQEDVAKLEAEKRQLERSKRQLLLARGATDKQIQFLDSTVSFSEVQVPIQIKTRFPKVDELSDTLALLGERYSDLLKNKERISNEIEDLEIELGVLRRRLKQLRRDSLHSLGVIEVVYRSEIPESVQLDVSYLTHRAGWTPFYDVDVNEELEDVRLTLLAEVRQQTGESWSSASLSLSNATPVSSGRLPQSTCWRLDLPAPPPTAIMAAGAAVMDETPIGAEEAVSLGEDLEDLEEVIFEDVGATGSLDPPQAEYASARRLESPLSFEYELPEKADLPSGDEASLLPVFSKQLSGSFYHHAVPATDRNAYLVCRTADDDELLAGRLNIHFSGRYLGHTQLEEKAAGDPLEINLGADRQVLIRRERVHDKLAETFFGVVDRSSVARELGFKISLENRKSLPVNLHLFDSVPVPSSDRIQVSGIKMTPEPDESDWRDQEGVMKWVFELQAGATEQVDLTFFVKFPKDKRPTGL